MARQVKTATQAMMTRRATQSILTRVRTQMAQFPGLVGKGNWGSRRTSKLEKEDQMSKLEHARKPCTSMGTRW